METAVIFSKRFQLLQSIADFLLGLPKERNLFLAQEVNEFIIGHVQKLGGLSQADFFVEIETEHEALITIIRRSFNIFTKLIRNSKANFHGWYSDTSFLNGLITHQNSELELSDSF